MKPDKPKIIVIIGPTSSGKSALAIKLAKKFNGEVISADSRQVYKGLDLGTGKVTKKEMGGIRHHLLDIASPKKDFSAGKYKKLADKTIKDILKRKKLPIICGGTAFYINQITTNASLPNTPRDNKLRKQLEKRSVEKLYETLKKLDMSRATNIDKFNKVRLIRAIEIAKSVGSVSKVEQTESPYQFLKMGLFSSYEQLQKSIEKRLKQRMKIGLLKEVAKLHKDGLSWKRLGLLGIEYHFLALYLQNKMSLEEALSQINIKSLQYAKKQMKWWKRDKEINWLDSTPNSSKFIKTTAELLKIN